MEIIQLRNKHALMIPAFQEFLKRMAERVPEFAPGGLNSIIPDLIDYIERPDHFFFLGIEGGEYQAAVLGNLPGRMFFPVPLVSIAYNEGSRTLLHELADKVIDHIVAAGYTKIWALNGSRHSDKVWLRAFANNRLDAKVKGTAFEFNVR